MAKTLFTTIGAAVLVFGMLTAEPPQPHPQHGPRVQVASR